MKNKIMYRLFRIIRATPMPFKMRDKLIDAWCWVFELVEGI
jgi:hypothetical protein